MNKYHSKATVCDGEVYDSVAEVIYAKDLELRRKAKDIRRWERQYRIRIVVAGEFICDHYVDFLIHHNDGTKELVEVKGKETDVWKLKKKLLLACFLKRRRKWRYTVEKVSCEWYR